MEMNLIDDIPGELTVSYGKTKPVTKSIIVDFREKKIKRPYGVEPDLEF